VRRWLGFARHRARRLDWRPRAGRHVLTQDRGRDQSTLFGHPGVCDGRRGSAGAGHRPPSSARRRVWSARPDKSTGARPAHRRPRSNSPASARRSRNQSLPKSESSVIGLVVARLCPTQGWWAAASARQASVADLQGELVVDQRKISVVRGRLGRGIATIGPEATRGAGLPSCSQGSVWHQPAENAGIAGLP
jgi:hypothetical protein